MRKITITISAAALALGLFATGAAAEDLEEIPNPAANESNCDAVGGEYSDTGWARTRVRTCTVTDGDGSIVNVPASHPTQAWTVDVQTPSSTTVYRLAAGEGSSVETTEGTGDPIVIACYNHQGNTVELPNSNCVPSS
jgi:hypothetical protein